MAKYFPDKPADVTCETCPYLYRHSSVAYCSRRSLGRDTRDHDGKPTASVDRPGELFCGEHPWFVECRALLDETHRSDVRAVYRQGD